MEIKYFFAEVEKVNEQERTIDAVASTADLDRDHDIILPSAFEKSLKPFKANPVILACHQHRLSTGSSPVIGSALPESIKIEQSRVPFTMRFAGTPLGEEYWQLYRDRHMRAFSIGFMPIEWKDEKDEKFGYIRTYTKIELLEISAVPVPSNPRALARAKGYFDNDDTKDISEKLEDLKAFCEQSFDEIKSLLIADSDKFAESLLGKGSEPFVPAGDDNTKAEQIYTQLRKLIEKHSSN